MQLYPKLLSYIQRFETKNTSSPKAKFKHFFTSLELQGSKCYLDNLPYLFDIELFALRLWQAKCKKEKVCIYSDYDTDAVTATGVMYRGLIILGFEPENLSFYAPDRFTEGYGLNPQAIQSLAQKNDLIVTVDCGINSTLEAEVAKQNGADLIITDHHHLHGKLPNCVAVINPRLSTNYHQNPELFGCKDTWNWDSKTNYYEYKNSFVDLNFLQAWLAKFKDKQTNFFDSHPQERLNNLQDSSLFVSSSVTGVGVAWFAVVWLAYFLATIEEGSNLTKDTKPKSNLKNKLLSLNTLLPLVAIGTVADCQSILEPTNRLLVKTGIDILAKNQHQILGLKLFLDRLGLSQKLQEGYFLSSQDLAFYLSPILNSSGRMTHASLSIKSVIEKDLAKAQKYTQELLDINEQRKKSVREIVDDIATEANKQANQGATLIWLEGVWSKGIVGLLASRLVNEHNLPVIVVSISKSENTDLDTATASLRSPKGYNLPQAMTKICDLLEKFGGHPQAAGFSAKPKNLAQIRQQMSLEVSKQAKNQLSTALSFAPKNLDLSPEMDKESIDIKNIWLEEEDLQILPSLLDQVWKISPFGQDFQMPSFIFCSQDYQLYWLGNQQKHLKVVLPQNTLSLVLFNLENFEAEKTQIIDDLILSSNQDPINSSSPSNQFLNVSSNEVSNKTLNESANSPAPIFFKVRISQNTWQGQTTNQLIIENFWIKTK
jgi:single-stranded-DNA-specific exonuclease